MPDSAPSRGETTEPVLVVAPGAASSQMIDDNVVAT
jgi:hypothetical protein